MRKLAMIVLMLPVLWFGTFVVLRIWMSAMQPSTEEIRRKTHARTLADAVCRTDAYSGPSTALVTALIDKGGDVNQLVSTEYGQQPLLAKAAACNKTAIVWLLLDRGAHVDDAGLGDVVERGFAEVARLLVDRGANVTAPWRPRDPRLGTQLIQAAVIGDQPWLVERLLAAHADVQVVNGYGRGLLALALARGGDWPGRCRTDCVALLTRLLAAHAHVNPLGADEAPPLVLAAHDGSTAALKLLLDAGADIDASAPSATLYPRSEQGSIANSRVTALTAAAYDCNVDAVRLLLNAGAKLPALGTRGEPVHPLFDICHEAWSRVSERTKQEQIRELLGVPALEARPN